MYDAVGNRILAADPTGIATYTYSSDNQPLSAVHPTGLAVTYTYDPVGRRGSMTNPQGGRFTYAYDPVGNLAGFVDPRQQRTTYAYNEVNRVVQKVVSSGAMTTHAYDRRGDLTQLLNTDGLGLLRTRYTYTYDFVGNRVQEVALDGVTTTWTYDRTYQIRNERRTVDPTGSFNTTYTYDPAGNRTLRSESGALTTYVYDAANQLLTETSAARSVSYTYDLDGHRSAQDDTSAGVTHYTWNDQQLLASAEPPIGETTLSYNADGQRVRKETPSEAKEFLYDFKHFLQQLDGDDPDRDCSFATGEGSHFVRGPNADAEGVSYLSLRRTAELHAAEQRRAWAAGRFRSCRPNGRAPRANEAGGVAGRFLIRGRETFGRRRGIHLQRDDAVRVGRRRAVADCRRRSLDRRDRGFEPGNRPACKRAQAREFRWESLCCFEGERCNAPADFCRGSAWPRG